MITPNSKSIVDVNEDASSSTIASYVPILPLKVKRFSRKTDTSYDSLNTSRILLGRGSPCPSTPTKTKRSTGQVGSKVLERDILEQIKSTAYIKTPRVHLNPENESLQRTGESKQGKEFLKYKLQRRNTAESKSQRLNEGTGDSRPQGSGQESSLLSSGEKRMRDGRKLVIGDTCRKLAYDTGVHSEQLGLELQIKKNEILVLEDRNCRLARSEAEKTRTIRELQKQIECLQLTNQQTISELQLIQESIHRLIRKYSSGAAQSKLAAVSPSQKKSTYLKLLIEKQLSAAIENFIQQQNFDLQQIIDDLRTKLSQCQISRSCLQIQNRLSMKPMVENNQLKNENAFLNYSLTKMREKCNSLSFECSRLRSFNNRLKNSISSLQNLRHAKNSQLQPCSRSQERSVSGWVGTAVPCDRVLGREKDEDDLSFSISDATVAEVECMIYD